MSSRSYLPKLAVSLYVLLFLLSIWSVIPSSFLGNASIALEPQPAICELGTSAGEGQQALESQSKDRTGRLANPWYSGWIGAGMQDVYSCALLMGASYN